VTAGSGGGPGLPEDVAVRLEAFESALDPARPTAASGVEVLGYGEVSAVLALAWLPGWVAKRMAGLRDREAALCYADLVERYCALLAEGGVRSVETRLLPVALPRRRPVVYLLQPRLDPRGLGHRILRDGGDALLGAALDRVLDAILGLWRANRRRADGREVAVDAQLSNWHFGGGPAGPGAPLLLDVGTPFMRLRGVDELDVEIFLAAIPPLARAWYRRRRAVERYLDDYFDARRLLVDLLGNFHKENRPDRISLALERANAWLAAHAGELGAPRPITAEDVARYYARDAAQLELFLRARRLDRFVRTRCLGRRYEFVLPGPIRR
jgi:hypothetical protein